MMNSIKFLLISFLFIKFNYVFNENPIDENFEIKFERGKNTSSEIKGKEKSQLECENESEYFCRKYPLNLVVCKHTSDSFTCSSKDMPFLITFYTTVMHCRTKKSEDEEWYQYLSSCYLRYTLGRDWLFIVSPLVAVIVLGSLITYGCIKHKNRIIVS